MRNTPLTSKINTSNFLFIQMTICIFGGICLSACQQVLERFEADLKGDKAKPLSLTTPDMENLPEAPNTKETAQITPKKPSFKLTTNLPPLDEAKLDKPVESKQRATTPKVQEVANATVTLPHTPNLTQTQKNSPSSQMKLIRTKNQVQSIDEDGNPLPSTAGNNKSTPFRVNIED
jgi:hypothetical protein